MKHPKKSSEDAALLATEDCQAFLSLSECEGNALYNLMGCTVFKKKNKCKTCERCIVGIASNMAMEHSKLTILKSYPRGSGLCRPSPIICNAIIAAEFVFKPNEAKFNQIQ